MNKLSGFFIILGVLGDFAFCQQLIQIPYAYQNIDPSRALFGSLFDKFIPLEVQNDTPTTAVPVTTTKPIQPTEQELIIIPAGYPAPIYDSNNYKFPPHPVINNGPVEDLGFLLDNYEINYPIINDDPSIYSPTGVQSLPYFNPSLINGVQDTIILQPIDSNAISEPANVNPSFGILPLPYLKPCLNNDPTEKIISQLDISKAIPKPWISTSQLQNESINNVEMTDDDRKALSREMQKLIASFIMKEQHNKNEETFDNDLVPTRSTIPIVENVFEENKDLNQTNKLDVNNGDTKPFGGESVSNSFSHYKQLQVNETTQSHIVMNQFDNATTSPNETETDESRKLDFGTGEEEDNDEGVDTHGDFNTIVTTDKSHFIHSEDLIKGLERRNHSLANNSRLNDLLMDPSFALPKFVNVNGENCSVMAGKYQGEVHLMIICDEESFDGKTERPAKSNVTFYTEELIADTTEPVKQLLDETMNSSSGSPDYELINTEPLNTKSCDTANESRMQFRIDDMVYNLTLQTTFPPYNRKIATSTITATPPTSTTSTITKIPTTTAKLTTKLTTEDGWVIVDEFINTSSPPSDSEESDI